MKKQIILTIFALFLIGSMIAMANAEIVFFQYKQDLGNGTIKNHLVAYYDKYGTGIGTDRVPANNPLEVYIYYNIYVQGWNKDNPNFRVNYCNYTIRTWQPLQNDTTLSHFEVFNDTTDDVGNAQYFLRLQDGAGVEADEICQFASSNYSQLLLPAEMQLIAPSWECKECQYYLWSVAEVNILKMKTIGNNIVAMSGYIGKLFLLNFEILLDLFWVFMILMLFVAVSFIFVGMYWLWLYLKRVIR